MRIFEILAKLTTAADRGEPAHLDAEETRALAHYMSLEGEPEEERQATVDRRTRIGQEIRREGRGG